METVAENRFCRMRPDGIVVLPTIGNNSGVFFILEYKRMSDVTDQHLRRSRLKVENQYVSLRSTRGCKGIRFYNGDCALVVDV